MGVFVRSVWFSAHFVAASYIFSFRQAEHVEKFLQIGKVERSS